MELRYPELLPRVGLELEQAEAILGAEAYSVRRIQAARAAIQALPDALAPGMASFALGSLGRMEAGPSSDLDLAFVYDSAIVPGDRARRMRRRCIERLTKQFEIPEKTFREAVDLRALIRNVGGAGDTNETLTYRALLLTEGAWLHNSVEAAKVKDGLFSIYARGEVSRGRFLNSLANDLHRYYRTLCVDYRFKVEEQDKTWAVRILKLRHSRKLWHLANLALQCWSVDARGDEYGDERDELIARHLDSPPLLRLFLAMDHFGAIETCRGVALAHERFVGAMASAAVRESLAELRHKERTESPIYMSLYENAARMDRAAAVVVDRLLERSREYLIRYCLL